MAWIGFNGFQASLIPDPDVLQRVKQMYSAKINYYRMEESKHDKKYLKSVCTESCISLNSVSDVFQVKSATVFPKDASENQTSFVFPSISVPARHLAALSPQRVSQMMWSSLHVTTLWCTTLCTPWADDPSLLEPMWFTASHRSLWTESTLQMDNMTSCSSAQV